MWVSLTENEREKNWIMSTESVSLPKFLFKIYHDTLISFSLSWRGKMLYLDGRIIFHNNVLSIFPIYFMSFSFLSWWVRKRIDRNRTRFLWEGSSDINKKYNLVAWGQVCKPKTEGGLRVIDMYLQFISIGKVVLALSLITLNTLLENDNLQIWPLGRDVACEQRFLDFGRVMIAKGFF